MSEFNSVIAMSEFVRDDLTGFAGHVTAICFYPHGPEQVKVEALDPDHGKIRVQWFDAPRLS